jgi:hypothetical protein
MILPLPPRRRVVLDTDTYNEVDDQFALAHLLLSDECVSLEAVYAAPFFNERSSGPADGMEKSHEEILRVLELVGKKPEPKALRGSRSRATRRTTWSSAPWRRARASFMSPPSQPSPTSPPRC